MAIPDSNCANMLWAEGRFTDLDLLGSAEWRAEPSDSQFDPALPRQVALLAASSLRPNHISTTWYRKQTNCTDVGLFKWYACYLQMFYKCAFDHPKCSSFTYKVRI